MKSVDKKKVTLRAYDLIRAPLVTEKATNLTQFNQYSFKVLSEATKPEIKQAVEQLFKVDVLAVNTAVVKGKKKVFKGRRGQRSDYKKAIVRLKVGQTLDTSVGI
jgi:large subunit ribosomal protein L23